MNGDRFPRPTAALLAAALGLLAASAGAQAATVSLRCAGRGGRNRDSAGTVLCAGTAARGRTLAGVVKDDAGKLVAARLTVTFSSWTPVGRDSFTIGVRETRTVTANGDGTFTVKDNPATKESIKVEVVADATLAVSGGAFAQADISRALVVRVAKLGGGVVRVTASGTRHRPLKAYVLDTSGYPLPGVKAKNVNGRGQATFNLGSRRGSFTTFVDAGTIGDLFWDQTRVPFKL
jgi:hypothetical protein